MLTMYANQNENLFYKFLANNAYPNIMFISLLAIPENEADNISEVAITSISINDDSSVSFEIVSSYK